MELFASVYHPNNAALSGQVLKKRVFGLALNHCISIHDREIDEMRREVKDMVGRQKAILQNLSKELSRTTRRNWLDLRDQAIDADTVFTPAADPTPTPER